MIVAAVFAAAMLQLAIIMIIIISEMINGVKSLLDFNLYSNYLADVHDKKKMKIKKSAMISIISMHYFRVHYILSEVYYH